MWFQEGENPRTYVLIWNRPLNHVSEHTKYLNLEGNPNFPLVLTIQSRPLKRLLQTSLGYSHFLVHGFSLPVPITMASEYQPPHPRALTTRANKYKIWEDFTDDLQASISTVLPTSSVKYKKICVLSITWAECDFDAITPETRFIDFVTQKYNWIAERYIIPTKDSSVSPPRNLSNFEMQQSAFCALFDFGRKNSANSARAHETLLIYMYSGHAHLGPSGKSLFWL